MEIGLSCLLFLISFAALFFIRSFLRYSISVIVFVNALAVLMATLNLDADAKSTMFQYVIIGHSFILLGLMSYIVFEIRR